MTCTELRRSPQIPMSVPEGGNLVTLSVILSLGRVWLKLQIP